MNRMYGIKAIENGIDRMIVALAKTHAHQSKEKAGIFQRLPLKVYLISNSLIILFSSPSFLEYAINLPLSSRRIHYIV